MSHVCTSGFVDDVMFFHNRFNARGVDNIDVGAVLKQNFKLYKVSGRGRNAV